MRARMLAAIGLAACVALPAVAAPCTGPMRKLNVGVAVSPPNVAHASPYVAKSLGFFAAHCIDANILQFEGGGSAAAVAAVAQGTVIGPLTEAAIAQGVRGKEIWGNAPRPPQSYFVTAEIKTFADLKGKRLSAAGGVGAFNWLMGREMLRQAGLTVDDAKFISQGTAGRLPGLLTGQLDGVTLHPEDVYLAEKQKPGTHALATLNDLLPHLSFGAYGAAQSFIDRDRPLLVDAVAALIEANRALYRERDKVIPIIVAATQKPQDSVEYALDWITAHCIWSVNEGLVPARIEWSLQFDIDNGDVEASKRPRVEDITDMSIARDAVAAAGGPTTIGSCKD